MQRELVLRLELPNDSAQVGSCRRMVRAILEALDAKEQQIDDIILALGELCSNVVRHAQLSPLGHYVVEVSVSLETLELSVTDSGAGMPDHILDPKPGQVGGYGLFIARTISDEFSV